MKVTSEKLKPNFKPFKITIEVETEKEANAILCIALTNSSVPAEAIRAWGNRISTDSKLMYDFLQGLKKNIAGKTTKSKKHLTSSMLE